MKLVLDTNCLIQVIPPRSRYYCIWQSSNDHHYDILKRIEYPKVDVLTITEFIALNNNKN